MLGHTRDELVGMGVSDIVVPEEYANAQNRLSSLLRGETLPIYERTFRKKDGSTIPVEIILSLILDDAGQPSMIQSIVRDISERKKVQQEQHRLLAELQQSRDELRALEAHLLQVVEEERRALAAELHDRVGQNLTGLHLNLNIISSQVFQYTDMAIQNRLEDSIELVEETSGSPCPSRAMVINPWDGIGSPSASHSQSAEQVPVLIPGRSAHLVHPPSWDCSPAFSKIRPGMVG